MNLPSSLSASYWQSFEVKKNDADFLLTYLFERETPSKTGELVEALVAERIRF